jgi:hypothetical protein
VSNGENSEHRLLPCECAVSTQSFVSWNRMEEREADEVDFIAGSTSETLCSPMEWELQTRSAMPSTATKHLVRAISAAAPNFEVPASGGVVFSETPSSVPDPSSRARTCRSRCTTDAFERGSRLAEPHMRLGAHEQVWTKLFRTRSFRQRT